MKAEMAVAAQHTSECGGCRAWGEIIPPARYVNTAVPGEDPTVALEKYAERARGATEREMALEAIAKINASAE